MPFFILIIWKAAVVVEDVSLAKIFGRPVARRRSILQVVWVDAFLIRGTVKPEACVALALISDVLAEKLHQKNLLHFFFGIDLSGRDVQMRRL